MKSKMYTGFLLLFILCCSAVADNLSLDCDREFPSVTFRTGAEGFLSSGYDFSQEGMITGGEVEVVNYYDGYAFLSGANGSKYHPVSPYVYCMNNPVNSIGTDDRSVDWYKDGTYQYSPNVHSQKDLTTGQRYIGKSFTTGKGHNLVQYRTEVSFIIMRRRLITECGIRLMYITAILEKKEAEKLEDSYFQAEKCWYCLTI